MLQVSVVQRMMLGVLGGRRSTMCKIRDDLYREEMVNMHLGGLYLLDP